MSPDPVAPRLADPTVDTHRPRRRRRAFATLVGGFVAVGAVAFTGPTAGAAPSAVPSNIVGDPHSPLVARLAEESLVALAVYDDTGTTADETAFADDLMATAAATADELGISEPALQRAWGRADRDHQIAVLNALTQLGVQYQSNTSEPGVGFDCSGLTSFAWGEAGVDLARQSGAQIDDATRREANTAMAGDLVQYPGHVMMYLGVEDAVVHSSNPENDVELGMLGERRAANVRYGDPTD